MTRHAVAAVHFEPKALPGIAPLECTCGWIGINSDFQDHRVAHSAVLQGKGWVSRRIKAERR